VRRELQLEGYSADWRLLNASDFGVPQLRPRAILVAMQYRYAGFFKWPQPPDPLVTTVGQALRDFMAENGWRGADDWAIGANRIAPTLVGGSKKHGGPDLGPTRAKRAWQALGVDGLGIADGPPAPDFAGTPRLTVRMAAALQGFPPDWEFAGRKTPAYRQVGNAFPPPVAHAVGAAIREALTCGHALPLAA
jgi:DNA (cytosine-5)-methyltransferase 1